MFEALDKALAAIVGKYAAVIGVVSPALRIGIVIYISLLGYAIMRGAVQYPFREYTYRGCQLAVLYFAVTSLYGSQIGMRSEQHTSELQSLMRISYAVFCLKKKKRLTNKHK